MSKVPASAQVTLVISQMFDPFDLTENEIVFAVYSPELNMGGSGYTKEEAEKQFRENLKMNVVRVKEQESLEEVLKGFGWTEKNGQLVPPESRVEKITVDL